MTTPLILFSGLAADANVFKWSLSQLLNWKSQPEVSCPVLHLHGDRDFVLPVRYTKPDATVTGGGHVSDSAVWQ